MKSLRLKKARNYAVAEQKWWWYVVNTNILELHVNNNLSTSTFRSGKDVLVFECDLLKRESIDHLFSTIASKVPSGIDILVNNAGKLHKVT